ncbi:MAG: hypothetical protein Kow00129_08710 [Thermoleophilia bacterium]
MHIEIQTVPAEGHWKVRVEVALDRQETNRLFLAGDKLISWPTEGMRSTGDGPMERSGMFLSEIVAREEGLELAYEAEEPAARAAKIIDYQVRNALAE